MSEVMREMEHPKVTTFVPPLVDERVHMRFYQAVQSYANEHGNAVEAAVKIREFQAGLSNLRNLASLCRLAFLGHPRAFQRVVDEMNAISSNFSQEPLQPPHEHAAKTGDLVILAAVIDLLAGAAFVSKNNLKQRNRFIIGIVRAIEAAVAFPVMIADEAASYLGQGTKALSKTEVSLVIANATQRLLQNDQKGAPQAPADIRARLEGLAQKWMCANPVTEFFEEATESRLCGIIESIQPNQAQVGDLVTLQLRQGVRTETILRDTAIMFCPHQPADVVHTSKHGLQVRVPENSLTGPIAIVRKGGSQRFASVTSLLERYAKEYPVEWFYSIFSFVPIPRWAYPTAFDGPIIEIEQVPQSVTVRAFNASGPLAEGQSVAVNDTVALHYRVHPFGSDANAPLRVSATGGDLVQAKPGVLIYRPSQRGNAQIEFAWGNLQLHLPVNAVEG